MQTSNVSSIQNSADNQDHALIDRLFALQQKHALHLRKSTYKERMDLLKRFENVFQRSFQKIYDAAKADYGKTEAEVDLTEIFAVTAELKHTKRKLKKWMKAKKVLPTMAMLGTSSKIIREPKGVCLVISPWNYPFNLSFGPMLTALAAGNTVILKPSEMTPNMSKAIREIVEEAFEPEEVSVIEGDAKVSSYLSSLPFDHIFFTGSPMVGKYVMEAAAKNLTSVTLELGGKSPTIVDETANIKKAAKNLSWAKCTNNGQTCIAPDYIYVHESVKNEFINEFKNSLNKAYGSESDLENNTDYCRIVNDRHYGRINNLLDDAVNKGAKIISGGSRNPDSNFIAPTLVDNISNDAEILEEEIFGPLLPILTYTDLTDVIAFINNKPKPLALYVYSKSKDNINRILTETSSGDACVNHNMLQFLHQNLPFGGVNNSGIGKAHGEHGFLAFSHERSVVTDHFNSTHMFFPPYKDKVKKLIKTAIKYVT